MVGPRRSDSSQRIVKDDEYVVGNSVIVVGYGPVARMVATTGSQFPETDLPGSTGPHAR